MKLPIYIYGHPVLRAKTEEITSDYPELKLLVENMFETMYASDGCGLAAPQVGKSLRLFVVDATDILKEEGVEEPEFKRVFINPIILESTEEQVDMHEGCLSIPGISEKVSRPKTIKIRYQDENLQEHTEVLTGFAARVFQHEYDHIEGVLFTDLISPIRKQLIKSKLKKISSGNFRAHYKTVIKK